MPSTPSTRDRRCVTHGWLPVVIATTVLCALAPTARADISGAERAALVDLYLATNGASWTYNYNWLDDPGTECYWRGVACDSDHTEVRGLNLAMNNLVGTLPGSLVNLIHLQGLDLEWDPITYSGDAGGYEVFVSPAGAASWSSVGWTGSKAVTEFPVTGLSPNVPYDVLVTSFTNPHSHNQNLVVSEPGEVATAATAAGSCARPSITVDWGPPITLSVSGSFTSHVWSTGETTASITVDPPSPQWYWVRVTAPSSCDETATVLVDPSSPIFADGFESGDTSAWSWP